MAPLTELIKSIREEFPKFELIPKDESGFMKLLNVLLLIITVGQQRSFMGQYTTTIGYKVYIPREWNDQRWEVRAVVLRHERVHMRQRQRLGMLMFSLWYLLLPMPLLFAAGRASFEKEAYAESMRADLEYFGSDYLDAGHRKWMIRQFTGPSYFWMWVGRKSVERWYDSVLHYLHATVVTPLD